VTKNQWIWHSVFGAPGTNNDLNILSFSSLFDDVLNGKSPTVSFQINQRKFESAYYLCNGIYPSWGAFIKSIPSPLDLATKHFNNSARGLPKGC
jgi:hypothetical protein